MEPKRFAETLLSLISEDSDVALEKPKKHSAPSRIFFAPNMTNGFAQNSDWPMMARWTLSGAGFRYSPNRQVDFTLFFRHLTYGNRRELSALFEIPLC